MYRRTGTLLLLLLLPHLLAVVECFLDYWLSGQLCASNDLYTPIRKEDTVKLHENHLNKKKLPKPSKLL